MVLSLRKAQFFRFVIAVLADWLPLKPINPLRVLYNMLNKLNALVLTTGKTGNMPTAELHAQRYYKFPIFRSIDTTEGGFCAERG
jgi:hypothetical protein